MQSRGYTGPYATRNPDFSGRAWSAFGSASLVVTVSPSSSAVGLGAPVLFTPTVSGGTPPYSYLWQFDSDLLWDAQLLAGLTHYYALEEASGPRVDMLGGTSWAASGTPGQAAGKHGQGANISVGNILEIAQTALLPATFTIGFWLNPSAFVELFGNDTPVLVSSSGSFGFDFVRRFVDHSALLSTYPSGVAGFGMADPFGLGSQHAVMIWYDGSQAGYQVDGSADTTFASVLNLSAGETMRMSWPVTTGVDGVFDEMPVWDHALAGDVRAAWFNSGIGKFFRGSREEIPSFAYDSPGTKHTSLTVTDAAGKSVTVIVDIEVT